MRVARVARLGSGRGCSEGGQVARLGSGRGCSEGGQGGQARQGAREQ